MISQIRSVLYTKKTKEFRFKFGNSLQITILRMMDMGADEDGAINRREKSKISKKKNDLRFLIQGNSIDDLDS